MLHLLIEHFPETITLNHILFHSYVVFIQKF